MRQHGSKVLKTVEFWGDPVSRQEGQPDQGSWMEPCSVPEPFLETQGMCKKVVGGRGLTVPGQPSPDIDILFCARWKAISERGDSVA